MFETIVGLLALPVIIWGWIILACIVYTASVENDKYGIAIFTTILGAVIFHAQIWAVMQSWPLMLACIAAYGIIGGAWSVYRWFKYCKKFIEDNPYSKHLKETGKEEHFAALLSPKRHKSRLMGWILFWPWSFVWNIIGDFVTSIYDALKRVYERVAQNVIRKALASTKNDA